MTGVEIAMIAGAALSAAGAVQQGNAAKQSAKFNAAVANNNAIASRQNASANAKRQAREARQRAGTNRASAAASGVYGGSAFDLLEDNAMEEELDRLTIIHQGELQAQGLEASAGLLTAQGKQAQIAGYTSAAGSLLKGGGALYDSGAFDSTPKQTSYATSGPKGSGAGMLI